jgi:predicted lysophospholipase L1 biosynthesis ABC-type transport system permease subunit
MSAAAPHERLSWSLALKLARREMRGGPDAKPLAGFRIFLLCLVLGIFTISAVGSLSASLVGGMMAQGQSILGGAMDCEKWHKSQIARPTPPKSCWSKPKRWMLTIRCMAR